VVFTVCLSATTAPIRSARAITGYRFNLPNTTCLDPKFQKCTTPMHMTRISQRRVFPEVDAMKTRF
jgi:hypothetical protein